MIQHGALVGILAAARPAPLPGEDDRHDFAAVFLEFEFYALGVRADDVGGHPARHQVFDMESHPVESLGGGGVRFLQHHQLLGHARRLLVAHASPLQSPADARHGDLDSALEVGG